MSHTMEGRNNHFFLAGITHFVGFLVLTIITMIQYFVFYSGGYVFESYVTFMYISIFVGLIISFILNIILFIAFNNLSSIMNLRSSEDTKSIVKLFLALFILVGLKFLSYALAFIPSFEQFMQIVIATLSIISAIIRFLAYFSIWKLIQKQELTGTIKIVSYAFLIYSLTTLLSGITSGIYMLGIESIMNGIMPLSNAFGTLNSGISPIIAFIYILFSIRIMDQNTRIIVPKQIPEKEINQKQCDNCGSILSTDIKFCVKCGTKIE
ncbi:MAG: zinc ribbon domain-containing protein [Candidatus Heimdallarchaeaceae archaeon]